MSDLISKSTQVDGPPPVSSFSGPIAELIGHRVLTAPSRPGVLACIDRFEVIRIIGSGGMGIVFLARDTRDGREVAVKVIRPELAVDRTMTHRFMKEIGHMQRLRHGAIVKVLEISDSEDRPYLVMPYFSRGSLASFPRAGKPMDQHMLQTIALQIAEGLHFAHLSGIIHRDLKPANVLLTDEGGACLSDFGLARTVFNDTLVDVEGQQVEGTAPYFSPGVAMGHAEDTRCDIYAFGALLYEMLTGEAPYAGQSTREIRDKIVAGPPRSIGELNPQADARLVTVAEGAMERELRDRYADMADVVDDLRRIQEGNSPVGAHGLRRRVRKGLSRGRRLTVGVFALAGAAAVTAAIGVVWKSLHPPALETPSAPQPIRVVAPRLLPLRFENPNGLAVDRSGNVFVADRSAYTVSRLSAGGRLDLVAGRYGSPGLSEGLSGRAQFSLIRGVAVEPDGNVIVSDGTRLRRMDAAGGVSTLAGLAGLPGSEDGRGKSARLDRPSGLGVDADGNVYVADVYTIRRVTTAGTVTTIAGVLGHSGGVDGPGKNAQFGDHDKGLAIDRFGILYVADSVNCTIRRIAPDGTVSTLAGSVHRPGSADGSGPMARFSRPCGIAVDRSGNLYIADTFNHTIRRMSPGGNVTTLAGSAGQAGDADGTASHARFNSPEGVAVDDAGRVFVADTGNRSLRRISADGQVVTLDRLP